MAEGLANRTALASISFTTAGACTKTRPCWAPKALQWRRKEAALDSSLTSRQFHRRLTGGGGRFGSLGCRPCRDMGQVMEVPTDDVSVGFPGLSPGTDGAWLQGRVARLEAPKAPLALVAGRHAQGPGPTPPRQEPHLFRRLEARLEGKPAMVQRLQMHQA